MNVCGFWFKLILLVLAAFCSLLFTNYHAVRGSRVAGTRRSQGMGSPLHCTSGVGESDYPHHPLNFSSKNIFSF